MIIADESAALDRPASQWSRVGAFWSTPPAADPVDLEVLIVKTARVAPADERMFIVTASWLAVHHQFVDSPRLESLAGDVAQESRANQDAASAVLGALLDVAIVGSGEKATTLIDARDVCLPARLVGMRPQPLFVVAREFRTLADRMRRDALPIYLKWGVWHDDAGLKLSAVRPLSWIVTHAPELIERIQMMAPIAHVPAVDEVRRVLELTYKQVASILRADERRLKQWISGTSVPSPVFLRRLENLEALVSEVRVTFRTSKAARRWLGARVPAFDDRRPLDLLLDGRVARVTSALQSLNAGVTT